MIKKEIKTMADYEEKPQANGTVFDNSKDRKNDRQPTHNGEIELPVDLLKELVSTHKAGETVKIRIAQWDRPQKSDPSRIHRYTRMEQSNRKVEPVVENKPDDISDEDIPL